MSKNDGGVPSISQARLPAAPNQEDRCPAGEGEAFSQWWNEAENMRRAEESAAWLRQKGCDASVVRVPRRIIGAAARVEVKGRSPKEEGIERLKKGIGERIKALERDAAELRREGALAKAEGVERLRGEYGAQLAALSAGDPERRRGAARSYGHVAHRLSQERARLTYQIDLPKTFRELSQVIDDLVSCAPTPAQRASIEPFARRFKAQADAVRSLPPRERTASIVQFVDRNVADLHSALQGISWNPPREISATRLIIEIQTMIAVRRSP